jgi:hypothetical protein
MSGLRTCSPRVSLAACVCPGAGSMSGRTAQPPGQLLLSAAAAHSAQCVAVWTQHLCRCCSRCSSQCEPACSSTRPRQCLSAAISLFQPQNHYSNLKINTRQHCLAQCTNLNGIVTHSQRACTLHVCMLPPYAPLTHTHSLDRRQHIHMCLVAVLDCEALRRHVSRPTHHSAPVHTRHSVLIDAAASNSNHATRGADLDTA